MVTRMYQNKKICTWVHRTWWFFASTNKSSPQIRRPFNKSARLPHRPRRQIDRPALQPHRCRAGAYVYEYNVSPSGTPAPPPPPTVAVLSTVTGYGENTKTDCTRPPRHLYHRRIVHISSARRRTHPTLLPTEDIRTHFRRCPSRRHHYLPISVAVRTTNGTREADN